jgi:hypothetical protein
VVEQPIRNRQVASSTLALGSKNAKKTKEFLKPVTDLPLSCIPVLFHQSSIVLFKYVHGVLCVFGCNDAHRMNTLRVFRPPIFIMTVSPTPASRRFRAPERLSVSASEKRIHYGRCWTGPVIQQSTEVYQASRSLGIQLP